MMASMPSACIATAREAWICNYGSSVHPHFSPYHVLCMSHTYLTSQNTSSRNAKALTNFPPGLYPAVVLYNLLSTMPLNFESSAYLLILSSIFAYVINVYHKQQGSQIKPTLPSP